jgi:DNA-binding PadR family transcriptional regulator
MKDLKQLFEIVENVAATRPSYSMPNFLPHTVLELGVLKVLEREDLSGDVIIRELAPLSRRASGYGVSYPLLHELEAEGKIMGYQAIDSHRRRVYALTEQGRLRLQQLRFKYSTADLEEFQTGLSLIHGSLNVTSSNDIATQAS